MENKAGNNIDRKSQPSKKQLQEEKLRDTKMIEQLLKTLNIFPTAEEKLTELIGKFTEIEKDNRKLNVTLKQNEKRIDIILREKENLQQEYNKTVLNKSKLENLCRELQRQNKTIKEESLSKIREEEEKRKETQAKFQKTLNDITAMMNDNNEKNQKLRDDNIEMSTKFKYILEQYELREQQVEKVSKQLELGNQLNDAKLTKLQMEMSVEKEIMLREQHELLRELEQCRQTVVEMQTKERLLKEQVNLYTEKYSDFQNSIQKSNDVFSGYKTEIDKMSKNMNKLEKETMSWRIKFEKSNSALLDLASEKQVRDQHIAKTSRQLSQLQKLCRTLQSERSVLLNTLKDNSIECPTMPECPIQEPEIEIVTPIEKTDKLDIMARSCAEFKQNLAQLQGQLSALTEVKKPIKESEPKKRKNKGKKDKNIGKVDIEDNNEGETKTENVVLEKGKTIETNSEIQTKQIETQSNVVSLENSSSIETNIESETKTENVDLDKVNLIETYSEKMQTQQIEIQNKDVSLDDSNSKEINLGKNDNISQNENKMLELESPTKISEVPSSSPDNTIKSSEIVQKNQAEAISDIVPHALPEVKSLDLQSNP